MATMNFSIPDEVKEAFNETFAGENKSAVIAQLMRDAIEKRQWAASQQERDARFDEALRRLKAMRESGRTYTADELRQLREHGRP